ncbi:MAG: hypothetical protein M1831_003298 [Alyxoria varia]|nr:MAG: hypothetical protein M1831_003298 [Alyxoria varia]
MSASDHIWTYPLNGYLSHREVEVRATVGIGVAWSAVEREFLSWILRRDIVPDVSYMQKAQWYSESVRVIDTTYKGQSTYRLLARTEDADGEFVFDVKVQRQSSVDAGGRQNMSV